MADPINILYLEDNPADARLMKEYLTESHAQYRFYTAANLTQALDYLAGNPVVDIILCDLSLPDSQGMDTFRKINARAGRIPMIVLSGLADEDIALTTVQEGAQDYLVKGRFDADLLVRSIRYAIERDRAARALAESETRYRGVGELIPFGTWTASPDGAITYLSNIFLDMVGMTMDECKGYAWTDRVHPEDVREMVSAWKQCVREETPWEYQYRIRDRFGNYRTVLSRGTPFLSYRGEVLSWSGINLDVSERVSYVEALGNSKQQLDTVVNTTHILLAYMDPQFNFIWVNKAYAEADGKDPSYFPGKNHFDLFPYGENDKIFAEVVRTGEPYYAFARAFEYADKPERGVSYWDWSVVPTKDGEGRINGLLFSLSNVTDRIRMQESLKASEEKYRLLVETVDSVISVDQDGVIKFINDQVRGLLGYSPEELIGKEVGFFLDDQEKEKERQRHYKWIAGESIDLSSTYRARHRNGDIRYIEVSGTLMIWEGRPAILTYMTDITERKRSESLISARATLFQYAASHSLEELLQRVLDEVGLLTNSPVGFYHFVEKDQKTLLLRAWSTRTITEFCKAEGKGMHYNLDQAGVWVDCVRERRPVIHNDYASLSHKKGLPEGHAPVIRELVVPILRSGRIVAVLGVGNKPTDYTQRDVEIVSHLADMAWEITENKLAEEALRESERRYHSLFENILDGFAYHEMLYDDRGEPLDYVYLEVNRAFEQQTGLKDVVGKRVTEVIPGIREQSPRLFEIYGRVAQTGAPERFEIDVAPMNMWFSISVYSPRRGYFVTVFENITERKKAEETIAQSLAEKEAMLREIHHRVKNNLQTVSSLLAMAGMSTRNRDAAGLLRDAESRVHAMALIHSQLYGSQRLDRIDVKGNIRELTDRLSSIYSTPSQGIVHSVQGDDVSLTIHQAIPAALAVNEIVTNAFKYAFKGKREGAITVRVGREGGTLSITVADNGIGLPHGFDIESTETLGLRLVKNLIEGQLAGKVEFFSSGGTSVTISFGIEGQ